MTELAWLGIVRHGESTGNVIAADAERRGLETIDIPERDADVPLSGTGREQAAALGELLRGEPPGLAVVSPYLRARQTAAIALAHGDVPQIVDERLRDRELGVLDLLTARGVRERIPAEAARRDRLGKFYYRPPGGESWADVLLRLRALLHELRQDHPDGRILLFAHDATVMMVRYLVEGLDEERLMALARRESIANAALTSWRRHDGVLVPEKFNDVSHLHRTGTPATAQEEVDAGDA